MTNDYRTPASIGRRRFLSGLAAAGAASAGTASFLGGWRPAPAGATPTTASTLASPSQPAPARWGRIENVQVTEPTPLLHVQPTLAANPRDPRHLFGVCLPFMTTKGTEPGGLVTYVSNDAGRSWQVGELPGSESFNDQSVAFDADGTGYVCADDVNHQVWVWRTEDGGRTFGAPVPVTPDERVDRPWLAADSTRSGQLHAAWSTSIDGADNAGLGYGRSTDGGRSFEPTRPIVTVQGPDEGLIASPGIAARGGVVHAIHTVWPPMEPPGEGGTRGEIAGPVRVVTSRDGGRTFAAPIELGRGTSELQVSAEATSPAIPAVAISPTAPVACAVFADRDPRNNFSELVISSSTDLGRSWSRAVSITPRREGVFYFQPQLACDPEGRFVVSAFRLVNGLVDVVVFVSRPNRPRFGPPVRVTSEPIDPTLGLPGGSKHGAWWIGDWQGLAVTKRTVHPIWNDTRTGRPEVFTATLTHRPIRSQD